MFIQNKFYYRKIGIMNLVKEDLINLLKYLVENGANVNAKNRYSEWELREKRYPTI